MFDLRPYQVEAVRAVLESAETSVAVALATGLGKTLLSKEIIRRYHERGARVVFVVPSIELMIQTGGVLETDNFLGDGMVPDWTKPILVSTVQSLSNNAARLSTYAFNVLIIDEAHHAVAASYLKVVGCQKWAKIVHLSATMFRKDGKKLGEVVDRVVFERDLHWSISEGYLSPYRLIRPKNADVLPCTTETVLIRRIDGQEKTIVRRSFDHAARNLIVRDLVASMFESENRKCAIMFCNTVAHAQKMAELLGDSWGWCSGEYRDDLQRFKRGELRGIVSVQLILEGFDHPPVDFLIVNGNIQANSTGAIRWIQLLGRALRLSEGKEYALALDLSVCGLPDISYQSDLGGDGAGTEEEEIEEIDIESLEIIERLEHPMLLTLADLLGGLRQVNNEYRRLKKELDTGMDLLQRGDIYTVVGTSWRLWRDGTAWTATDGFKTIERAPLSAIESRIAPERYTIKKDKSPTENQIELLKKKKVNPELIAGMSRAEASEYLSKLLAEEESEPATMKQINFLRWKKVTIPVNLSKRQAARLIAQTHAKGTR